MKKKIYLLPFLIFALNAQEVTSVPVIEPVITDLDLLVESVKTTASIRAKEDKARLNKFLSDKNKQQSLLDNMKYKLTLEERRSDKLTKQYEDNDAELSDLEEQLTLKLGSFGELFGIDELIGTDPEEHLGEFTGKVNGTPSFKEGKVTRLFD